MGKKIVDAQQDQNGNISAVKFKDNKNFTSREKAIEMAEKGKIDNAHAVHKKDGNIYLRSNPDKIKKNNLDDMAES